MSEESKKAVEGAKASEALHVQNLGFNPYETTAVTAGQAKKTVVDVIHGKINTNNVAEAPTPSSTNTNNTPTPSIHESFDTTFSTFLSSSNSSNKTSLSILT